MQYIDRLFIPFNDGTYRWLDVKRFAMASTHRDDREVLAAMIAHARYRDTYATADSHMADAQDCHGPFRVDGITPDRFTRLQSLGAEAVTKQFCNLDGNSAPPPVRSAITEAMLQYGSDPHVFMLDMPRDSDAHDFSFIFLAFHELVYIDHSNASLGLFVLGVD